MTYCIQEAAGLGTDVLSDNSVNFESHKKSGKTFLEIVLYTLLYTKESSVLKRLTHEIHQSTQTVVLQHLIKSYAVWVCVCVVQEVLLV